MDQQNYSLADLSDSQSNQGSNEDEYLSDTQSNQGLNEDEVPDDLMCGICRDIYLDPQELIPCEHVFCETCLRRLNQARIYNCPICRRQIMNTLPVEDLRNQIMERYPQHVQERAEAEQQSNSYSLDLLPRWMELIRTFFGMQFQIDLDLRLVLRFGFHEVLLLLMMVLTEFYRLIMMVCQENVPSIPTLMAVFFARILMLTVALFFFNNN